MAESLQQHAQDLTGYLNDNVFDHDELSAADMLDALASLGMTLVEDPASDSGPVLLRTHLRSGGVQRG